MRENFPPAEPPAAVPPAPASEPAAGTSAGFAGPHSAGRDAPGLPGAAVPAGAGSAPGLSPAWLRQCLVWLLAALVILLATLAAIVFVRDLQSTQALHAVARVALPAIEQGEAHVGVQERAPAVSPPQPPDGAAQSLAGAAPAIAGVDTTAAPAPTPASGPIGITAAAAPAASDRASAAGTPGTAGPGEAEGRETKTRETKPGETGTSEAGTGGAGASVPGQVQESGAKALADSEGASPGAAKPVQARERDGTAKARQRTSPAEQRAAAKRTARASGTFKRCPPLGNKGAVMCRWHICNGGAGKEPACRPYLERRP